MNKTTWILLGITAILFSGCTKKNQEPQTTGVELPPVFVQEAIAEKAVPIPEARNQFKAGDKVVLSGLIMGVPDPFVNERAVFILGDEGTLAPCDPGHCSVPWDTCCDPVDIRMKGTATIQVVDENKQPLHIGLKGVNQLNELSRVTVAGTVAANSTPDAFIVNADAIYVAVQ